jgi:biopolymer transport protein ExbB/TolQ
MLTAQLLRIAAVSGEWILWVLIALSVYSFGIVVDRFRFFSRGSVDLDALGKKLLAHLEAGDQNAACALLDASPSVEAAVARRCLDWLDAGPDAVSEVAAAALREYRPSLDKGTVTLGTIGSNAPFIGLLGTVLGVVSAFRELGAHAASGMTNVMSGIGEALIATAVGIVVAVPGIVFFNIFSTKAALIEERAQGLMHLVLAFQKRKIAMAPQNLAAAALAQPRPVQAL